MCFACYGSNHISRGCTKKKTCRKCGKRHPTALHIDGFKLNKKGDGAIDEVIKVYSACVDVPQSSRNPSGIEETIVLHAIVPVKLKPNVHNLRLLRWW